MGNNPTPPPPGKGRPLGSANRATVEAREAIARFVDGHAERLNDWLEAIAAGEKKTQKVLVDGQEFIKETDEWMRRPDPQAAFNAFMSVVEYHIPKLARTELNANHSGDLVVQIVKYGSHTDTGK